MLIRPSSLAGSRLPGLSPGPAFDPSAVGDPSVESSSSNPSSIIPNTMAPSLLPARNIPRRRMLSGSLNNALVIAACLALSVAS